MRCVMNEAVEDGVGKGGVADEVAHRLAGSVLREAEALMRLVPTNAPLLFEVQVDTRDVARLHVGDHATIKLEARPWQQFGLAYGVPKALTPDTVSDDRRPTLMS
jgi:membrane fusion protein, hemolysin D